MAKADGQLLPPRKEKMPFEEHSKKGESNAELQKKTNVENTFELVNYAQKPETTLHAIEIKDTATEHGLHKTSGTSTAKGSILASVGNHS